MKTLLQTWKETLICGYAFVINAVTGVRVLLKESEVDCLCGTSSVSREWCMRAFERYQV